MSRCTKLKLYNKNEFDVIIDNYANYPIDLGRLR